jgi:polyisoprenoid-binding protein YceI
MTTTNQTTNAKLWTVDPIHTTVGFSVRHLMITNVRGVFEKVEGTVRFDPQRPEAAEVHVSIPAGSIQTREANRDAHLKSPDFLDVASHPTIAFRSTRVRRGGDGPLEVIGDLTLRGTTREVTLAVSEITGEHKDFQGARRIGASATTKIKRSDFGMTFNKIVETGGIGIGDEVSLSFDVSLVESPAT